MAYQGLRIIDFHSHFPTAKPMMGGSQTLGVSPPEAGPYPFSYPDSPTHPRGPEKAAIIREWMKMYNDDWRLAWDFPPPGKEKQSDEILADRWAAEVGKYGLARVAFVTGGGNDNLAQVIARHPDKLVGFAHHNLFAENAAEELERAITELGLRGYKLLAPALDKRIEDKSAWRVWEIAEKHDIPVLIHFGVLGSGGGVAWHENSNPLKLHDVARAFPTVKFIVPHFGCGWVRETLQLCWSCANVYVDTSGANQWIHWMPEELTVKMLLRKYLETIGPERLIFATDSSWFPRGFAIRYLQDQLRDCRELNVPPDALAKIFGGNAARLLKLDK